MKVMRASERPTRRAPADAFTGTVLQDPIIEAPEPARLRSNVVMFEPGGMAAIGRRLLARRRSPVVPPADGGGRTSPREDR